MLIVVLCHLLGAIEMNEAKQNTQLLTAKAMAKMLSTSVRSIWRYRSAGRLPETVKIGGAIRWKQQDIEQWISMGCPDRRTFEAMRGGRK